MFCFLVCRNVVDEIQKYINFILYLVHHPINRSDKLHIHCSASDARQQQQPLFCQIPCKSPFSFKVFYPNFWEEQFLGLVKSKQSAQIKQILVQNNNLPKFSKAIASRFSALISFRGDHFSGQFMY
jgi:hypothetical protein